MATSSDIHRDEHKSVKEQAAELADDIVSEVKHEVHNIRYTKEPVDATQSDVLVQRHVTGLAISLFVLIAVILLIAIGGIALYAHQHQAGPARHVGALVMHVV